MKTLRYVLTAVLAMLIGCVLTYVLLENKNPFTGSTFITEMTENEDLVQTQVDPIDVEYTQVGEVLQAHTDMIESHAVDSTFRAMSLQKVANVTNVLLDRFDKVTIRWIVSEYLKNKSIYDPLSKSNTTFGSTELHLDTGTVIRARDNPTTMDSTNTSTVNTTRS